MNYLIAFMIVLSSSSAFAKDTVETDADQKQQTAQVGLDAARTETNAVIAAARTIDEVVVALKAQDEKLKNIVYLNRARMIYKNKKQP